MSNSIENESTSVNIDPAKRTQSFTLRPAAHAKGGKEVSGMLVEGGVVDEVRHGDLVKELMEMPEVREDVLELGRRLARDPDYPSDEALEKLAEMLADEEEEDFPEVFE